jgi:hypothetical protein
MNEPCNPFNDAEMKVIAAYSRRDALRDGVLMDLTALAREAGHRFPVAISNEVFAILAPWAEGVTGDVSKPAEGQPLYGLGQSFGSRAWNVLTLLLSEFRRGNVGVQVEFAPLLLMPGSRSGRPEPVGLVALCGPDDDGPCITIMLPTQD